MRARNVEPREGDAGQDTCIFWIKIKRERALSWLFEELQLDEVMVFVAKLVTIFDGLWDL